MALELDFGWEVEQTCIYLFGQRLLKAGLVAG